MILPNCPVCNTNEEIEHIPDCSTHAQGCTNGSIYHSDNFYCRKCDGYIAYREETVDGKIMWVQINYRKDNYIPNVKIVN